MLPDYSELDEIRETRAHGIAAEAERILKEELHNRLIETEKAIADAEEIRRQSESDAVTKKLELKKLVLADGIKYSSAYSLPEKYRVELRNRVLQAGEESGFSEEWVQKTVNEVTGTFLRERFLDLKSDMIRKMKHIYADCVLQFDIEEGFDTESFFTGLTGITPTETVHNLDEETLKEMGVKTISKGVVIATTTVIFGTIVMPIPPILVILYSAGVALKKLLGIGNDKRMKQREKIADEYACQVISQFVISMRAFISDSFDKYADYLGGVSFRNTAAETDSLLLEKQETLLNAIKILG